jgi:ribosomal protein S27AE
MNTLADYALALVGRDERIEKLEAALREYADRRNWRVSDSSSGYLDRWIGDDGPTIAQLALGREACPKCGGALAYNAEVEQAAETRQEVAIKGAVCLRCGWREAEAK